MSLEVKPTYFEDLVQTLKENAGTICKYLHQSEADAMGDKPEFHNDPRFSDPRISALRISDLQLTKRDDTLLGKFRTVMSQRSLALEYIDWEKKAFGSSNVLDLMDTRNGSPEARWGYVAEYLRINHDKFSGFEQGLTRAIPHGIKLLLCEKQSKSIITSAVLWFAPGNCKKLRFDEMRRLSDTLNSWQWFRSLVEEKTDWYLRCVKRYDCMFICLA